MKKAGLTLCAASVALSMLLGFGVNSASSRQQYKKAFEGKFCDSKSSDPSVQALVAAVSTAKCNVCHEGTTSKKERNRYGQELAKLLRPNTKDEALIDKALDAAMDLKSDVNDSSSPTFGELLRQGKLPGRN